MDYHYDVSGIGHDGPAQVGDTIMYPVTIIAEGCEAVMIYFDTKDTADVFGRLIVGHAKMIGMD